jgi:hypothetical protein
MFFPYPQGSAVVETPKSVKYDEPGADNMRSWATQATLERLLTGDSCEEQGCFEVGVWLVSFNGESFHLCSKHTRVQMKDSARWADAFGTKVIE